MNFNCSLCPRPTFSYLDLTCFHNYNRSLLVVVFTICYSVIVAVVSNWQLLLGVSTFRILWFRLIWLLSSQAVWCTNLISNGIVIHHQLPQFQIANLHNFNTVWDRKIYRTKFCVKVTPKKAPNPRIIFCFVCNCWAASSASQAQSILYSWVTLIAVSRNTKNNQT